jgi:hydroxymethylglutaryl-CoA reductase
MQDYGTSRIPGFYNLTIGERREQVANIMDSAGLPGFSLKPEDGLTESQADHMIENVVGIFGLPYGIATNFLVNGREMLIPMVIEEPSVVAGASFMAKLAREGGGFKAQATPPEMIGQIQLLDVTDAQQAQEEILEHREEILSLANSVDPVLNKLGGGARDLQIRLLDPTPAGPMLIVHLIYDVRDAMGANAVNSAAEAVSQELETISGGRAHLRILSNLADLRLAKASCKIPVGSLAFDDYPGEIVRDGIIEAWAFAAVDPYRAATHNKGIMNGIDAVVIATGNDWRAVEAGAHAYAARTGSYTSLSTWSMDADGSLLGDLELPLAVGTVGGATRVHPFAKASLELMGVETARELSEVIVSVGLAQNLAALRALATEGIQRGHMALHARQIAIAAGAEGDRINRIARQLVHEGTINVERARRILEETS